MLISILFLVLETQVIWRTVKNYNFSKNNNKLMAKIAVRTVSFTQLGVHFAIKFPPIIDKGKKVKTNNPFDFSGVSIKMVTPIIKHKTMFLYKVTWLVAMLFKLVN